jgi:phage-related holin
MKLIFAGTLAFISQFAFVPTYNLLFALAFVIGLDFITGCYKARRKGEATTSQGFRRTIDKFVTYGVAVATSSVLCFVSSNKGGESVKLISGFLNDGLVCLIIYIEVVSIFENLIEITPEGPLSQYFFRPVLKFLTLQISKTGNAIAAAAGEQAAK